MDLTNTQAYFNMATFTSVKKFYSSDPGLE